MPLSNRWPFRDDIRSRPRIQAQDKKSIGEVRLSTRPRKRPRQEPCGVSAPIQRPVKLSVQQGIEKCFLETVEKLQNDKNGKLSLFRGTRHPLYQRLCSLRLKNTQQRPIEKGPAIDAYLPEVTKAYEESFLREVGEDETPCSKKSECEGVVMAKHNPHTTHEGFLLPAFIAPNETESSTALCVLCLRRQVSLWYFNHKARGITPTEIGQPYRVIVKQQGEYDPRAVIYPNHSSFSGITDPFVRHERHHYHYEDKIIRQSPNMSYLNEYALNCFDDGLPSTYQEQLRASFSTEIMDQIMPSSRESMTKIYHLLSTKRLQFHTRFLLQYLNEVHFTQLFHLEEEPFHYGRLYDMVHVLPLCSFFHNRREHGIPIVHILSKALPQRCQYRNLRVILVEYIEAEPSLLNWFLRCLRCTLFGYYPHSATNPLPPEVFVTLQYGFKSTTFDQWIQWMTSHHILVYYVLREQIIFLLKYDPSLYQTIQQVYYWTELEDLCIHSMQVMRTMLISNALHGKPFFDGIDRTLMKFNSYQLKYMYKIPKYHNFREALSEVFRLRRHEMYCKVIDARGDADGLKQVFVLHPMHDHQIKDICKYVSRREIREKEDEWLRVMGVSQYGINLWQELRYMFSICDRSVAQCLKACQRFLLCDFIILNTYLRHLEDQHSIQTFRLPDHWRAHQEAVLATQFDGHVSTIFYICTSCKKFKGFVGTTNSDQRILATAFGQDKVLFDVYTGKKFCAQKNTRKAPFKHSFKKTRHSIAQRARDWRRDDENRQCAETECIGIDLLGTLLHCYGKCYVLCPRCARPALYQFCYYEGSSFQCKLCASRPHHDIKEKACCCYCQQEHNQLFQIVLKDDSRVQLCLRHYRKRYNHLTKHQLFRAIEEQSRRSYG